MKRKKGFTLVELAVVSGIIAVVSSVAYTSYGKYIRQSRQLEAKANLSTVRQLQISHFQDQRELEWDFKKIGFLPKGKIRYNIGTTFRRMVGPKFHTALVKEDASESICPCNNDGDINGDDGSTPDPLDPDSHLADNKKCWAHPRPDRSSLSHAEVQTICSDATKKKCFGPIEEEDMGQQLLDTIGQRVINPNGHRIGYNYMDFVYVAIGCTSSSEKYLENSNLDIWSISRTGVLSNIQSGI